MPTSSGSPGSVTNVKQSKSLKGTICVPETGEDKLNRLLSELLTSKIQRPSKYVRRTSSSKAEQPQPTLNDFCQKYSSQRVFNSQNSAKTACFRSILSILVKDFLSNETWAENGSLSSLLSVLTSIRILVRDPEMRTLFLSEDVCGLPPIGKWLLKLSTLHNDYPDSEDVIAALNEISTIIQKLIDNKAICQTLVENNIHAVLELLLSTSQRPILRRVLQLLIVICEQSVEARKDLARVDAECIDHLITIFQEPYEVEDKKFAVQLLGLICNERPGRELVKVNDTCIRLLLGDRQYNSTVEERPFCGLPSGHIGGRALPKLALSQDTSLVTKSSLPKIDEQREHMLSLKCVTCVALTELSLNHTNSLKIAQLNGIYILGLLILPQKTSTEIEENAVITLQKAALRVLRFLFEVERHRRFFKRIFCTDILEQFINIGHYNRDNDAYAKVVSAINNLPEDKVIEMKEGLEAINVQRQVRSYIGEYEQLELLGSGAFGSVYRVRKRTTSQSSQLALKEINLLHPVFGKNSSDRTKSVNDVISELQIIREQLQHPNIVRYHKTFVDGSKLCVVMQLIDGAPLADHFSSLKEKHRHFKEERIWNIFLQIILALRYLHKEKNISHRDLTSNNIMLGEGDHVTITDFGLAKHKNEKGELRSEVGTFIYRCPEMVQHKPYTEKADIWSTGCLLYQMATLDPPFSGNNVLTLAQKIVDGHYEPIPSDLQYTDAVNQAVTACLTISPEHRPDSVQLLSSLADVLTLYLERERKKRVKLEMTLEQERKRFQSYMTQMSYCSSYQPRMMSSGGSQSIRTFQDGDISEPSECELSADATKLSDLSMRSRTISDSVSASPRSVTKLPLLVENTETSSCLTNTDKDQSTPTLQSSEQFKTFPNDSTAEAGENVKKRNPEDSKLKLSEGTETNCNGLSQNTSNHVQFTGNATFGARRCLPLEDPLSVDTKARSRMDSGISSENPSPSTPNWTQIVTNNNNIDLDGISPLAAHLQPANGGMSPSTETVPNRQLSIISQYSQGSASGQQHNRSRSSSHGSSCSLARPSPGRNRPNSTSYLGTVSMPPSKVRQIGDPVQRLLSTLHKLVYVTQLPPHVTDPRKRVVNRYKRALFNHNSSSANLKSELQKLNTGSQEVLDPNLALGDLSLVINKHSVQHSASAPKLGSPSADKSAHQDLVNATGLEFDPDLPITYEHLMSIIESLINDSDYYIFNAQPNESQPTNIGINPGYSEMYSLTNGSPKVLPQRDSKN